MLRLRTFYFPFYYYVEGVPLQGLSYNHLKLYELIRNQDYIYRHLSLMLKKQP